MARKPTQEKLDKEVFVRKMIKAAAIIDAHVWAKSGRKFSNLKLSFRIKKTSRSYGQTISEAKYIDKDTTAYGIGLSAFTFDLVNTLLREKYPSDKGLKSVPEEAKYLEITTEPTEEELSWAVYQMDTENIDISALHLGKTRFKLIYQTTLTMSCTKDVYADTKEEAEAYGHHIAMCGIIPSSYEYYSIPDRQSRLTTYDFGRPDDYLQRAYLKEVKPK